MSQVPAGWFPDPYGRFQQRYWNGSAWTEHVVTNGVQAVDPMGASTVIPIVTPASAYTAPASATATAAPTVSPIIGFLDSLGDDSKERPIPSLSRALAGLGGASLAIGVLAATSGDNPSRGVIIGSSLAVLAVAWVARSFIAIDAVRAAAVGMAVVAIPAFGASATVSDGRSGFLTAFVIGALYVAAWALPGFKGRSVFLGLGALALVGALGSLDTTDSSSGNIVPRGITDNLGKQGTIYLIGAALCLGATWALDRRGYRGTGTAFGAAGLVAALVGTGLLVNDFGQTSGPIFVMVVGLIVCLVGSHGGRRATTWWGAVLLAGGMIAFVGTEMNPASSSSTGTVAIIAGLVLIGVSLVASAIRRGKAADGDASGVSDGSGALR